MNERIKAVLEQAEKWAKGVVDQRNGTYQGKEYLDVVEEKFAELIVKECADRLTMEAIHYDTLGGREVAAQTMDTASALLKQHFGVE